MNFIRATIKPLNTDDYLDFHVAAHRETYQISSQTIETERLCLIPLTARQLRLWLENIQTLENELKCVYRAEPLEGFFKDIVSGQLDITENDVGNYLFTAFGSLSEKQIAS